MKTDLLENFKLSLLIYVKTDPITAQSVVTDVQHRNEF